MWELSDNGDHKGVSTCNCEFSLNVKIIQCISKKKIYSSDKNNHVGILKLKEIEI